MGATKRRIENGLFKNKQRFLQKNKKRHKQFTFEGLFKRSIIKKKKRITLTKKLNGFRSTKKKIETST